MNKYLTIVISLVVLLFAVGTVYASHVSDKIPYPLKGLGGCSSYAECRKYCHDPLHYPECRDFAKQNNIKSKDIPEEDKKIVFNNAKKLLGCDGQETCQTHCAKKDNFDKCSSFAKFVGMTGGYMINPTNEALRKRADEFLGCELDKDCKNFCDVAENKEKCTSFAQKEGLGGGIREVGPGGCTSKETCSQFCQNPENQKRYSDCGVLDIRGEPPFPDRGIKKSVNPLGGSVDSQNPGPGGCTSDQACQSYCDDSKNKEECSKYHWSGPGGCTDQASCSSYCQKNYQDPDCSKYGGGDSGKYQQQLQQYEQQKQQNLQQFQQMEGQKQGKQQEYDQAQQKYNAKQQEYNQMQNSGEYQQKMQQYQQMQGQYDQKQQEYNQMQGQYDAKQQEYNQMQQQQSQPQAPPTGVQGTSTSRGLLQIILERLGF